VADRYISPEYAAAHIGGSLIDALSESSSSILSILIEAATASVQPAMRNSGYNVTSTGTDYTLMTDETVKLAVVGALWISLSTRPEFSVKLPDGWAEHPANVARKQILNGDAPLTLAKSVVGAVGGVKFSDPITYPSKSGGTNLVDY
jgi:hypothetical protein